MRSNGWPMRRRSGCDGLVVGELGAVGTIGLLGQPGWRSISVPVLSAAPRGDFITFHAWVT